MPDRMPEYLPDLRHLRSSEYMSGRMTSYMSDTMSKYVSDRMADRMPEHLPDSARWSECVR